MDAPVIIGRIKTPFGVHGWVRILSYANDADLWRGFVGLLLGGKKEDPIWRAAHFVACQRKGQQLIARIDGVSDRTTAMQFSGEWVGAPSSSLPQTPNQWYWGQWQGLSVVNLKGKYLGKVTELLDSPAHAVVRVLDGEKERLLPCVETVICDVRLDEQILKVDWSAEW